jgi:hypothetical protein
MFIAWNWYERILEINPDELHFNQRIKQSNSYQQSCDHLFWYKSLSFNQLYYDDVGISWIWNIYENYSL